MKTIVLSRVRLMFLAIFLFALVLVGKLYFLQIVSGEEYVAKAERQYLKLNESIFNRGNIYFRKKDGGLVTAATQQSGFTVAIDPRILENPEEVYNKLSSVTSISKNKFFAQASKISDPYEEIAKKVDNETGRKIENLGIKGLNLYREKWRLYPGNTISAHMLGLVGYRDDDLGGRYGLERYYDETLKRDPGSSYANFFAEVFLNAKNATSSKGEGDIVTTIEPTVEAFLEKELKGITDKWNSKYTGGIIINPKTGEIIAMAVDPTFSPNHFSNEKNSAVFSNPLVENVFEMGSIIKPFTLAAGIDSGKITAKTTYFDSGFVTLNNKTISNYDNRGRGLIDMQTVINQSLNTGATFAMLQMGRETFSKYMLDYGLGEKTGIDLPNEASNLVNNLKSPRDIEHATASFGQGIALTPISTVRALSVLANGGLSIVPHIVAKINYKSGLFKEISPGTGRQIIKKETSEEITRMLVKAVDTALLQGRAKIENYSIAAKTGTAQIAKEEGGGYYDDRYLHSFFGYFPAYNPKFLVFLFTYQPKGVKYAEGTLALPFLDTVKFLINYYEISPDR